MLALVDSDGMRLTTLIAIARETGVSAATIKRWSELPSFPRPARTSGTRKYWLRSSVVRWLQMTNLEPAAVAVRAKANHQEAK